MELKEWIKTLRVPKGEPELELALKSLGELAEKGVLADFSAEDRGSICVPAFEIETRGNRPSRYFHGLRAVLVDCETMGEKIGIVAIRDPVAKTTKPSRYVYESHKLLKWSK